MSSVARGADSPVIDGEARGGSAFHTGIRVALQAAVSNVVLVAEDASNVLGNVASTVEGVGPPSGRHLQLTVPVATRFPSG